MSIQSKNSFFIFLLSLWLVGCSHQELLVLECAKSTGEVRFEVGEEKTISGYPIRWTNQNREAKWGGRSAIVGYLNKGDTVQFFNEFSGRS